MLIKHKQRNASFIVMFYLENRLEQGVSKVKHPQKNTPRLFFLLLLLCQKQLSDKDSTCPWQCHSSLLTASWLYDAQKLNSSKNSDSSLFFSYFKTSFQNY